jgi:hypothetical protein
MKRIEIKNPGTILIIWILIAAVLSGMATLWSLDSGFTENPKIFMIYFGILISPILWILFPSLVQKDQTKDKKKK